MLLNFEFALNTITDRQNYATERFLIEDIENGHFSFSQYFVFSTLDDFLDKIYEKTCCFYNILSKSISNSTCLPSLLSEYIFQKCYHPFNIVSIFFNFQPLLREKLWKDLTILWLIFKVPDLMYTLTKISHLKMFTKKMAVFQNVNNLLLISQTYINIMTFFERNPACFHLLRKSYLLH